MSRSRIVYYICMVERRIDALEDHGNTSFGPDGSAVASLIQVLLELNDRLKAHDEIKE